MSGDGGKKDVLSFFEVGVNGPPPTIERSQRVQTDMVPITVVNVGGRKGTLVQFQGGYNTPQGGLLGMFGATRRVEGEAMVVPDGRVIVAGGEKWARFRNYQFSMVVTAGGELLIGSGNVVPTREGGINFGGLIAGQGDNLMLMPDGNFVQVGGGTGIRIGVDGLKGGVVLALGVEKGGGDGFPDSCDSMIAVRCDDGRRLMFYPVDRKAVKKNQQEMLARPRVAGRMMELIGEDVGPREPRKFRFGGRDDWVAVGFNRVSGGSELMLARLPNGGEEGFVRCRVDDFCRDNGILASNLSEIIDQGTVTNFADDEKNRGQWVTIVRREEGQVLVGRVRYDIQSGQPLVEQIWVPHKRLVRKDKVAEIEANEWPDVSRVEVMAKGRKLTVEGWSWRGDSDDRLVDEDAIGVVRLDDGKGKVAGVRVILADGMGGHGRGEIASSQAVEAMGESDDLALAMKIANEKVVKVAKGGGSTVVVADVVVGENGMVETGYVWRGDSRLFAVGKGGQVVQVTKDHSLVQSLLEKGIITAADVRSHPQRNVIYRNLGDPKSPVNLETEGVRHLDGQPPLLLCCDGFYGYIEAMGGTIDGFLRDCVARTRKGSVGELSGEDIVESLRILKQQNGQIGFDDNVSFLWVH